MEPLTEKEPTMTTRTLPTPETHPRGYWVGRGAHRWWIVLPEPAAERVAERVAAHQQAVAIAAAQQAVIQAAWDACSPAEQAAMAATLENANALRERRALRNNMDHGTGPDYTAALARFQRGVVAALAPWRGPSTAELTRQLEAAIAAHDAAKAPLRAHIARLTGAAR